MTDDDEVISTTPMMAWPHPAAMEADERLAAAYRRVTRVTVTKGDDPAYAPWDRLARFAPPGPAHASLTAPAFIVALRAGPVDWTVHAPEPTPDLPEAWFDESAVLERIATIAEPSVVEPLGELDDLILDEPASADLDPEPEPVDRPPEPEDDAAPAVERPGESAAPDLVADITDHFPPPLAHPPIKAPADQADTLPPATPPVDAPTAAYWATAPEQTPAAAGSLAWTPPPATGPAPGQRATPAMSGLWAVAPVGGAVDFNEAPIERPARRSLPRLVKIGAGVAVLAAACAACVIVLPRLLSSSAFPTATFNAPMMVLRAAGMGRVSNVAVKNGQTVEPSTLLLTIHMDPQPDPGTTLLQDRLEAARSRLSSLDDAFAQPAPNTDAGRTRMADLRRQRATALTDVTQLQEGLAAIPTKAPADQPVRAGVHGIIRSLEAQAGGLTTAGVPLVRMLDCDHAFLTVGPESKLQVGQTVEVKLANLPAVTAIIRKSAGIAEPPDSLVIAPAPGAFVQILSGACPIGATATVTPAPAGS